MGCDGGSTPTRVEMVAMKKKAATVDPKELTRIKWTRCACSLEVLTEPVVTCDLGYLYNKESVIQALINKNMPESFSHVERLKDVIELRLTRNPEAERALVVTQDNPDDFVASWICPITGLEMNGMHRFVTLRSCGCVVTERALLAVTSGECLVCAAPYTPDDVLVLNGSDDEVTALKGRMLIRREQAAQAKLAKKASKKAKERQQEDDCSVTLCSSGTAPTSSASSASVCVSASSAHPSEPSASSSSSRRPAAVAASSAHSLKRARDDPPDGSSEKRSRSGTADEHSHKPKTLDIPADVVVSAIHAKQKQQNSVYASIFSSSVNVH